ncbi:hypothetical protein [Acinetobacter venetianus]
MIHDHKGQNFQINALLVSHKIKFSEREIECAINIFNLNNYFGTSSNSSLLQKDLILTNYINHQPQVENAVSYLIASVQNRLVSIDNLNWIEENDYRLLIWLLNRLSTQYNRLIIIHGINNPYKTFLYNIDGINISIDEKILFLQNCFSFWNVNKLSDQEIKWLDPLNSEQLAWAWQYLAKHGLQIECFNFTYNDQSKYMSILACLDNLSYGTPESKELILLKMKKTWSQKKFRDSGKAKKPYHLPLTIETQAQLEELAKLKNMNKSKVLEAIILKEFNEFKLK